MTCGLGHLGDTEYTKLRAKLVPRSEIGQKRNMGKRSWYAPMLLMLGSLLRQKLRHVRRRFEARINAVMCFFLAPRPGDIRRQL